MGKEQSKLFLKFIFLLRKKQEVGIREHGKKIPPIDQLFLELEMELLDICGWGFLLWMRLEELKKKTKEAQGVNIEVVIAMLQGSTTRGQIVNYLKEYRKKL